MLSFYEIYGGQCYDLLTNRTKLDVLEDRNNNVSYFISFRYKFKDYSNNKLITNKICFC